MRFQPIHPGFRHDTVDIVFGHDPNRVRSPRMGNRANASGPMGRRDDLGQRQFGRKRAPQRHDQFGGLGQIGHMVHRDGSRQHMKRPERATVPHRIEIREWFAVGFDPASGIGGIVL